MSSLRRVASGRAVLATEAFGEPERGTILLVMGATASMLWWPESLCRTLADAGYKVIRFDHRDTGASTTGAPGAPDYALEDMLQDLFAILDDYGVAAAHLVGMSLGGFLSQLAALRQPERVCSLTLVASEPVGGTDYAGAEIAPGFMAHFATMAEIDWSDRAAVRNFLLGIAELSSGSRHAFDANASLARIDAELDRTASMQSAFNHAMLGADFDAFRSVRDIRQPTLVIHGSDDPVIPLAAGEALARFIPDTRLLVLEGIGHELPAPELPGIAEAILAFLSASAGPRPS